MAENTRVVKERKWLETNMNLPQVDDNLYVHMLSRRNIPFDSGQKQLNRQNNWGS